MNKLIAPVKAPAEFSGFQDKVLQEENSVTRERILFKVMDSLKQEDEVVNDYQITRLGDDFKINFKDGRKITWSSDNLPVDWLDVLWNYATTEHKVVPMG